MKTALPSYTICSNSLPLPPQTWASLPPRFTRFYDTRISSYYYYYHHYYELLVLFPHTSLYFNCCVTDTQHGKLIQSNPAISNSVNSKSRLFRRKIEFPWIYPYVFSHLLSAISNSVISNSPLFRTHRSFPTP